jgi:hypothetical protein
MSRGSSRTANALDDDENLLGLSGWVYSDLLLGIAIVFLAAVSFQAINPVVAESELVVEELEAEVEVEEIERSCTAGIGLNHIEVFIPYDLRGVPLLERVELSIETGLADVYPDVDPNAATFGFMLAFGGSADSGEGGARALASSEAVIALLPERFERVVSRAYWGGRGRELAGNVRLDLFPYITEPCDDN